MVLDKGLFYCRVACNGLNQPKQGVLVKRIVDRSRNSECLTATEEVGIAYRCLFMHAIHLGLLQYVAEVAQLGISLQLFPKCATSGTAIGGTLIMVVPV